MSNLPAESTTFIGRAGEREQIQEALASTRLLVLTGSGGSGKTRLALKVAEDVAPQFPDGAWWVELAPLVEPAQCAPVLAGVLGVRPLPGRTAVQAIVGRLADDRALVVVDNCEHLLDAAADLSEALLRGCPRVVVLATSREPLRVPGETEWKVPSLSLPADVEAAVTVDAVEASDAGRLFLDRASKVWPAMSLDDHDAAGVARICRELDGMPLAIELASARVRVLSIDQIADGLSDHLRLLTGGPRGVDPRQQTLRASVDWSYALLDDDERVLLHRLAAFVGGGSLEAIEAVCADEVLERTRILDVLTSLVDKSLVAVEPYGRGRRFRLLETVRLYAHELLTASGEDPAVEARHQACFLALAERAAIELDVPPNLDWLTILEPEAANLHAAMDHAVDHDPDEALRMATALTPWWELSGRFTAGQEALARALDAADPAAELRSRALWGYGHLARFRGDSETTERYAAQALDLAVASGDERTESRALVTLGHLVTTVDPQGCRPKLERGLELARRIGDNWSVVNALVALGRSYLVTDDMDLGEAVFAEVEASAEHAGLDAEVWASSGRAWFAMVQAQHDRMAELCERTFAAASEQHDPVRAAWASAVLAGSELLRGRVDEACERMERSEARAVAAGAGFLFPRARTELARALAARGELDRARALLEGVVAGGADGGWLLCRALAALAEVARAQGDEPAARERAGEALDISVRIGARSVTASGRELLARLAIDRGEWSEADSLAQDALALRQEIKAVVWLPQSLDVLAQVAAGRGAHVDASRLLGAADRARADLGLVRPPLYAASYADLERALEDELGERSDQLRAEGSAMTLVDAIAWVRRARGARKRPALGWDALTPTEGAVVRHVVEGMTNPEIATKMFISRATVKTHLAHIFKKLGVDSRAQLAAQAAGKVDKSARWPM